MTRFEAIGRYPAPLASIVKSLCARVKSRSATLKPMEQSQRDLAERSRRRFADLHVVHNPWPVQAQLATRADAHASLPRPGAARGRSMRLRRGRTNVATA